MSDPLKKRKTPWYHDGLRFSCREGCQKCCGGAPGEVYLTSDEIQAIAQYLGIPRKAFVETYTRITIRGGLGLKEKPNWDCILLGDTGCTVYPVRPAQCRSYPFWPEILRSPKTWRQEKKYCPGIGEGTLYTADMIDRIRRGEENAIGQ